MRLISTFLLSLIFLSCSNQKEKGPNIKGIWKSIANITYENFKLKDSSSVTSQKYKYLDGNKELWFETSQYTDSLGKIQFNDIYLGGKTIFSADSVNVVIDAYHDNAMKGPWGDWLKNVATKTGWNGKFTFEGDLLKWGNMGKNGNGWYEIWEKVDDIGESPSPLTGKFERVSRMIKRNNGSIDSLAIESNENNHNIWYFGDNKLVRVFNDQRLDSLGNELNPGVAFFSSYEFVNDSIQENFISYTSNISKYQKERGGRKFKASVDKEFFQFTLSFDGGEYTQYFKKIN